MLPFTPSITPSLHFQWHTFPRGPHPSHSACGLCESLIRRVPCLLELVWDLSPWHSPWELLSLPSTFRQEVLGTGPLPSPTKSYGTFPRCPSSSLAPVWLDDKLQGVGIGPDSFNTVTPSQAQGPGCCQMPCKCLFTRWMRGRRLYEDGYRITRIIHALHLPLPRYTAATYGSRAIVTNPLWSLGLLQTATCLLPPMEVFSKRERYAVFPTQDEPQAPIIWVSWGEPPATDQPETPPNGGSLEHSACRKQWRCPCFTFFDVKHTLQVKQCCSSQQILPGGRTTKYTGLLRKRKGRRSLLVFSWRGVRPRYPRKLKTL